MKPRRETATTDAQVVSCDYSLEDGYLSKVVGRFPYDSDAASKLFEFGYENASESQNEFATCANELGWTKASNSFNRYGRSIYVDGREVLCLEGIAVA